MLELTITCTGIYTGLTIEPIKIEIKDDHIIIFKQHFLI
jgi:hypothetical protein